MMAQQREELSLPSTSKPQVNTFLQSIENHFQQVLRYENDALLGLAKSSIPIVTLQLNASQQLRNNQLNLKKGDKNECEMGYEDFLLLELLNWFKISFFKWVDSPPCSFCESKTKYSHNITRSSSFENLRVEVFKCGNCETQTEFTRYNDPKKLLQTRAGRCGEWANCFTLLCRALNYDARFVVDTLDHVWTEVYSVFLKRWVHCDPCENVMDAPLMYEAGWGKKLEYVIAYSRDDVQDVTWRYTSDHKAVLARRNKCTERELVSTLIRLRDSRWPRMTAVRKKFVTQRICRELVDLMVEKKASDDEKVGRTSGSLTWRLQRKETDKLWAPHTWKLKDEKVIIRYAAYKDVYEMILPDSTLLQKKKQWTDGAYAIENMARKEEHDWKMVYLAREENSENAKITWKVVTDNPTMTIDSIKIRVSSQTYESGTVEWTLHTNQESITIPKNHESNFFLSNIKNTTEFTLTANLSKGNGKLAWQHTQIFRQRMDSKEYPFQICVMLKSVLC